jgi:hypothetical protein
MKPSLVALIRVVVPAELVRVTCTAMNKPSTARLAVNVDSISLAIGVQFAGLTATAGDALAQYIHW